MHTAVAFRYLAYDNVTVGPLQTVRVFDDPSHQVGPEDRIVDLPEDALGAALLADRQVRQLIYEALRLGPDTAYALKVRAPFIYSHHEKPGDIDVMLSPQRAPQYTHVLETKRAKVRPGKGGAGQRITHLTLAQPEVAQVNRLADFEFSRTTLALLVAVEDYARSEISVIMRGMTPQTVTKILNVSLQAALDPRVGLCVVEIVQPTTRSFSKCGCVGVALLRPPAVVEQPGHVTRRVVSVFDRRKNTE